MTDDTRLLLAALEDYHAMLRNQATTLRAELEPLRRSWGALSSVYEGTAAEYFREGWLRTERMLQDYLATVERLDPVLHGRIDALRDADRIDTSIS